MSKRKQKLELTWIGKDERPRLEPRILIEELQRDYTFHCPGCGCSHWFKTNGKGPQWSWNGNFVKPTEENYAAMSRIWERMKHLAQFPHFLP